MDFIIAGPNFPRKLNRQDCLGAFDGGREAWSHSGKAYSLACSQEPRLNEDGSGFVFSGIAHAQGLFIKGDYRRIGSDQLSSLASRLREKPESVSGVFSFVEFSQSSVVIRTDLLSQYPLFIYEDERSAGHYLISNNIHLIARALKSVNVPIRKSAEAISQALIFGTTFSDETGYEAIKLLPPDVTVSINETGELKKSERDPFDVPNAGQYRDYLTDTATELKETVGEAFQHLGADFNQVVDLTGGADSRMVMAAVKAAGFADDARVFCMGGPARADRMVADYLIQKYEFRPATVYISNDSEELSFEEFLRRGMGRHFGMKYSEFNDTGSYYIDDYARYSGYFGEFSRVFDEQLLSKGQSVETLVDSYLQKRPADNVLVTDAGRNSFREKMLSELTAISDRFSVESGAAAREFYRRNRSRVHFGLAARLASTVRVGIHPLSTPRLGQLSAMLNSKLSAKNKVAFDLISALAGRKFAKEPMANKPWDKALFWNRWLYRRYLKRAVIREGDEPIAPRVPMPGKKPGRSSGLKTITNDFTQKVRREGREYFWYLLPSCFALIDEHLKNMSEDDPLFDAVSRDRLLAMLDAGYESIDHNMKAKNCLRMAAALVWWNSECEPNSILGEVSGKFD